MYSFTNIRWQCSTCPRIRLRTPIPHHDIHDSSSATTTFTSPTKSVFPCNKLQYTKSWNCHPKYQSPERKPSIYGIAHWYDIHVSLFKLSIRTLPDGFYIRPNHTTVRLEEVYLIKLSTSSFSDQGLVPSDWFSASIYGVSQVTRDQSTH